MKKNENVKEVVIKNSAVKAILHAFLIPFIIVFFGIIFFKISIAVYTAITWVVSFFIIYKFSKNKQLTAYFFNFILKIEVFFVGFYIIFIIIMYLIARFT